MMFFEHLRMAKAAEDVARWCAVRGLGDQAVLNQNLAFRHRHAFLAKAAAIVAVIATIAWAVLP